MSGRLGSLLLDLLVLDLTVGGAVVAAFTYETWSRWLLREMKQIDD
jgi:hypothetical protein